MAKKEPSLRMRKAAALIAENGGNKYQAFKEAGYSEEIARNPKKITTGVTWNELVDSYLPDDMILRSLADDIEKKEGNRVAELTLATKMKGKLVDRSDVTTQGEKITGITEEEKAALLSLLK
jgi:hypothetical protein